MESSSKEAPFLRYIFCPKCKKKQYLLLEEYGRGFREITEKCFLRVRCTNCGHRFLVSAIINHLTEEDKEILEENPIFFKAEKKFIEKGYW